MDKKLREFCMANRLTALWKAPLSDFTSFRIGGVADAVLLPDREGALMELLSFLKRERIRFRLIGNGTNIYFADEGFRGVIISTRRMRDVRVVGNTVRAAAGTPLNVLCRTLADRSLGGLEPLYGIPGTVGGAVVMNAGAFGSTIADHLTYVSVYRAEQGEIQTLPKQALGFSYRNSALLHEKETAILSVEFYFPTVNSEIITEKMRQNIKRRMDTQPTALPSAGSTFLRPEDGYAAAWIEKAGLKGLRIGGAAVSLKHAGFVVNLGDATAADVNALIAEIQKRVLEQFGISLIPEVEYIG